jgi:AraC-like DNA-binding protein
MEYVPKYDRCCGKQYGPKMTAGGFSFYTTGFNLGENVEKHEHQLDQVIFVRSGRYQETLGQNRTHERSAPAILFLPAGMPHQCVHFAPGKHFVIEASRQELESIGFMTGIPVKIALDEAMFDIHRLIHEFESPRPEPTAFLKGLAQMMFGHAEWTACLGLVQKRLPAWLRALKSLVDENFLKAWTLEELSYEVGVDPEYLTDKFTSVYGLSPSKYLHMRRIRYACELLQTTDLTLPEVAICAKFADQAHFSRTFRYYLGVTPKTFMQIARRLTRTTRPLPFRKTDRNPWNDQLTSDGTVLPLLPKVGGKKR